LRLLPQDHPPLVRRVVPAPVDEIEITIMKKHTRIPRHVDRHELGFDDGVLVHDGSFDACRPHDAAAQRDGAEQ
jgi:hypothetical protein